MLESYEEAEELNGECAFCGRIKFLISPLPEGNYQLIRCAIKICLQHCQWNHIGTHVYQEPSEEQAMINRGS